MPRLGLACAPLAALGLSACDLAGDSVRVLSGGRHATDVGGPLVVTLDLPQAGPNDAFTLGSESRATASLGTSGSEPSRGFSGTGRTDGRYLGTDVPAFPATRGRDDGQFEWSPDESRYRLAGGGTISASGDTLDLRLNDQRILFFRR